MLASRRDARRPYAARHRQRSGADPAVRGRTRQRPRNAPLGRWQRGRVLAGVARQRGRCGTTSPRRPISIYCRQGRAPPAHECQCGAARRAHARRHSSNSVSRAGTTRPSTATSSSPPASRPASKYPIAFIVHGGPQVSFQNQWNWRWNAQTYAARGYGVVFIDFHGSPGYGQAFTDSISQHWGDRPFEDLQKGLAAALQKYPWLDGKRACSLGASYGGFMQNWIAGNWPDGFRCIVNHAGIFDTRSMYYTTEELWFTEWENGGPYYEKPEIHERFNPASNVKEWRTPMLVIHGEKDFRVPYSQGLATFTALQRRGIESRLRGVPRRESLGTEAGQQHLLVRHRARLAGLAYAHALGATTLARPRARQLTRAWRAERAGRPWACCRRRCRSSSSCPRPAGCRRCLRHARRSAAMPRAARAARAGCATGPAA